MQERFNFAYGFRRFSSWLGDSKTGMSWWKSMAEKLVSSWQPERRAGEQGQRKKVQGPDIDLKDKLPGHPNITRVLLQF